MKEITFQLVRGTGLVSRAIGYFGAGFYSHIDTVTPLGLLRGARSDVIHEIPAGVEDRPQNYERWAHVTRYTILATEPQYDQFWRFSDAQMGKPYDVRGLVDSFILGREWRENDSWWCSELVGACGEAAGLWQVPPEVRAIDPGDCVFLLAGLGANRKEF